MNYKWLSKNNDHLAIVSAGGCTKIANAFSKIIEYNTVSDLSSKSFDNVVIITDRDEIGTEVSFINRLSYAFKDNGILSYESILNNAWCKFNYLNGSKDENECKVLLLLIPFEDTGALEKFLLNAVATQDATGTERKVIDQCNVFIDNFDSDKKYLQHRRDRTKAKFDTYFSVRTPVDQFGERRNILKNIKWEEYEKVQASFEELGLLG